MLCGRGLEMVDAAGQVRGQFTVEPDGEAVFRLRDQRGTIRARLGASNDGSGLILIDKTTNPGVQILARRTPVSGRQTTRTNLTGPGGRRQVVAPLAWRSLMTDASPRLLATARLMGSDAKRRNAACIVESRYRSVSRD
jgi:hypothetical protein